jgi:hypothetical protein
LYAAALQATGRDGLCRYNIAYSFANGFAYSFANGFAYKYYFIMLEGVMNFTWTHMLIIGTVALVLGGAGIAGFAYTRVGFRNQEGMLVRVGGSREGFKDSPVCNTCNNPKPLCGCKNKNTCNSCNQPASACACGASGASGASGVSGLFKSPPIAPCPRTMEPDLSKYILKSQVPVCNKAVNSPDMTNYMLKTECPPVPDLSKYVLKSSIPKPQPVIIDNSKCKGDAGECPPCPRPRCPVVKCPPPTKCPTPAPCPRAVCPPTVVKCKSEESTQSTVRPFLAPLNMSGFGLA